MAKVKEIYIEAKRSANFQTYTVGFLVDIADEEDKDIPFLTRQLQARCRNLGQEQINIDKGVKNVPVKEETEDFI